MWARRAHLALVAVAAGLALGAGTAGAATPDDYGALAGELSAPWPALQRSDGSFREYVAGRNPRNRDDYGEAMLGYGLLHAGVRLGDDALIDAGLRGVTRDAELRDAGEPVRMFRNMAIAAAYNLARARIPDHPEFARVRAVWERRLRQVSVSRLVRGRKLTNKALVEAVLILELTRSGLRSDDTRTVLGDPARALAMVDRLLRGRIPRSRTPAARADAPAARLALIGDAPEYPLAYHALSTGFLARAIELLGPRAPAAARRLLRESTAASWALVAPDGDVAYVGRSQEQIWALSLTAYAAEIARAEQPSSAAAADLTALADRTLARIGRDHRGGPAGFAITPALARDVGGGRRGLDSYASAVQYTGLGLVGLNWANDAARPDAVAGQTAADREGSAILGRGAARFATVRAGDVWFAVRQEPSRTGDLRYDFGLVALKARAADGTWRDVLPVRPASRTPGDSAGPLLLVRGGPARPHGRRLRVADGVVVVTGGFRDRKSRRRGRDADFVFEPHGRCVRTSLRNPPRGPLEYSVFLRGRHGRADRSDDLQDLTVDATAKGSVSGAYGSGTDPRLTRVRLRFPRGSAAVVDTCSRPR